MTGKNKIILTGILLIGLLLALVVSSLAWFQANKFLQTQQITVQAADTGSLNVNIPQNQVQEEAYLGQTGIEYEGYDSPYFLLYFPVSVDSNVADGKYMQCNISSGTITAAVETATPRVLTAEEIRENFTWRLELVTVNYVETEPKLYKPDNGFLFCESTGEYLRVLPQSNYRFRLYIYFLGEEGYSLLTTTHADIDESYVFAFSDVSFMWATFDLTVNISTGSPRTVTFVSNGGSPCEPIITGGASAITLPTPTHADPRYVFEGWYESPGFEGVPFENDTLLNSPKDSDFNLYAKWRIKPTVYYDYNGVTVSGQTSSSVVLENGQTASPLNLGDVGDSRFITWTTVPFTYAEYTSGDNSAYLYNFSSPVNSDVRLYAVWRPIVRYTVTFHIKHYSALGTVLYNGTLTVNGVNYTDTYTLTLEEGTNLSTYSTLTPVGNNGRNFRCWGTARGAVTPTEFNFNVNLTQNVDVYAYYRAV